MTTTTGQRSAKVPNKALTVGMQVSRFRETWTVTSIVILPRGQYAITLSNSRMVLDDVYAAATKWIVCPVSS